VTHPLDQLAPFVDGTIAPAERASVVDHVRTCARCRDEVAAAAAARDVLREMPAPDAPDLAARFSPERIAELAAPGAARSPWRKAAPALAAAAVVALLALVVPRLGTTPEELRTAADGVAERGASTAEGDVRLEIDDTDYDEATLQDAADAFAATLDGRDGAEAAPASDAASAAAESDQARYAGPGRSIQAIVCLRRAFPGFPGEIQRASLATFDGAEVFLGYVLESPGGGRPPDTLSIWVAATDGCSPLSITSVRL